MLLVDVHTHLDSREFNQEREEMIKRAEKSGVKVMINNGVNHKTNIKSVELTKKHSSIRAALGLHPSYIKELTKEMIEKEIKWIGKKREEIIAIGEIGLDYYWIKQEEKKEELKIRQKEMFEEFLELAAKLKKPVIIHSREACADVLESLERFEGRVKVILHSFTGNKEEIERAASKGYYFSVPTHVVRKKHFQGLVKMVNLSQLLTETDAPYMAVKSGGRSEPADIKKGVEKIAELKGMIAEEVANIIYANYKRVFE